MRSCLTLSVLFLLVSGVAADDKKATAFDQFKSLVGDWEGKMISGGQTLEKATVSYKLTSGGTTLVETLGPGSEHEMVTVVHKDGDSVMLTHYCMIGNQPQMKAANKVDGNKVAFKFIRATNMKSEKDMHMHDVTYTFVDKDTFKAEWTHYMDGKPAGTAVFEMKRKK